MMHNYLVIWKTWLEDEVQIPWPWAPIARLKEFKRRDDLSIVDPTVVESIYLDLNSDKIAEFEEKHVDAIKLACMIESGSDESAIRDLMVLFKDAEIVSCRLIPDQLVSEVLIQLKKNEHRW
jgi:hypothetical protein